MDTLTPQQRHKNMSNIRGKDTKPEIIVRKYFFSRGLRYRKNDNSLPGRPDIVFPKYKTVVFINGCFWHGHEGCHYFRIPKTNTNFWIKKINQNRTRDEEKEIQLKAMGWKVLTIWECELKKKANLDSLLEQILNFIIENKKFG